MKPVLNSPWAVAALLAALAAACVGGPTGSPTLAPSPTPTPDATADPTPTATPTLSPSPTPRPTESPQPVPTPTAVVAGWPDVGPAPTPEPDGTLLMAHVVWGDTGPAMQRLVVLADGRVVMYRDSPDGSGWVLETRRLSTAGLAKIRDGLTAVGLFDRDRTRQLIKPLNCCGAGDQLRVRLAEKTVRVERMLAYPENYAPDARWDRFDALVERLRDVDTWLSDTDWLDPAWAAYHAPRFCLSLTRDTWGDGTLDADVLAWPVGVWPFSGFGEPAWEGASGRVGIVDAAAAYALATSIAEAATRAAIPAADYYPVRLEDGGTRFWSPRFIVGDLEWQASLSPLPPRWRTCFEG